MRVIRAGVDSQLAVHRFAERGLRQHPAYCVLDQPFRVPLTHQARAFFAQPAFVA
jgi:hypothetical protein